MNVLITTTAIFMFHVIFSCSVFAVQITGCHCFKNRQFDAAQPGIADPYILATTQNSFLAAIFKIDKKQIVQAKMSGTSGDSLWVAHYVASKIKVEPAKLLASRKISSSWKKALEHDKLDFTLLELHFREALARDPSDNELSASIVDQMVLKHFAAEKIEVEKMRTEGASNKEIILSVFLSRRTKRPASVYYSSVISGRNTWGAILNDLKIEAQEMGTEINKMLKKHNSLLAHQASQYVGACFYRLKCT